MQADSVGKENSWKQNIAEDERLVKAAQNNREAFGALYEKYWENVYRFVYRRIEDEARVQDITQRVFIKAFHGLKKYKSQGFAFSSWLFRIAVSEISNETKHEARQRAVHAQSNELSELMNEAETDHTADIRVMVSVLNQLKDDDLLLIEMRFFEKRRIKEIAELLDLTETNCKVKIHRCLKRLKKLIEKNREQED